MRVITVDLYSRPLVVSKPDHLFLFGSNLANTGMGGQAVIRGLKNSYGIPTKKKPDNFESSFFHDNDFENNIKIIKEYIDNIPYQNYKVIVFPSDGLGTGRAKMPSKCPKTFHWMNQYLNNFIEKVKNYEKEAI